MGFKGWILARAAAGTAAIAILNAVLSSAARAQSPSTGFDVDDLNIMFAPLESGRTSALSPDVPIGSFNIAGLGMNTVAAQAQANLISVDLFNEVEKFAGDHGIGIPVSVIDHDPQMQLFGKSRPAYTFHDGAILDNWRVVSLRYDPCFPAVNPQDTGQCVEQIRLSAQPLTADSPVGADTTMHLIYAARGLQSSANGTLSPRYGEIPGPGELDQSTSVLSQLKALKVLALSLGVDTNGAALGPHPALVPDTAGDPGGVFAAAVKAFIVRNCSAEKLMGLTYMGRQDRDSHPWIFFGGDANVGAAQRGHWQVQSQPTTAQINGKSFLDITYDPLASGPTLTPVPQAVSGIADSATNLSRVLDFDGSPGTVPAAFADTINRLEQPRVHHPKNTDCVSCHAATAMMTLLDIKPVSSLSSGSSIGSASAAKPFIPVDGISAYVDHANVPDGLYSLHNFSFFHSVPQVSYLTAASVSDVANFTNTLLGLKNSGVHCATDDQRLDLRICTLFSDSLASCVLQTPGCQASASP